MATEAKTKPPPDPPVALCDRHLTRAPGPGRYDLPSEFGPHKRGAFRWSMPGKPRQERREDPTPGPDKYAHPRTSFGGTRPTMAARFTYRDREAYHPEPPKDGKAVVPPAVKSTLGGAKFSFGGRVRQVRPDVTPGPGHCDPLAALKFTSQKVPAFSMGSKYRTLNRDPYYTPESGPKDGKAVNPPAVKGFIGGGPKYSMGGKTSRPRDDVMPGPGMYPGANQDFLGKNGPRYSMSARIRGGIQYGHWGDEPRLKETRVLPSLNPPVLASH